MVNNSYLGLIRQSQRGFDMDYCVQLSFENVNSPELGSYGVDHVKVVEGLGCKAIRVTEPDDLLPAFERAKQLMKEHRLPVVVEVILERVTNVSMGTEIDGVVEFEELALARRGRPHGDRTAGLDAAMPTVLIASDKFKGSLTAAQVADAVAEGVRRARPDVRVESVPVADGGDGTIAAALAAGFEHVAVVASGPTGSRCTPVTRAARTWRWWRWPTCPG